MARDRLPVGDTGAKWGPLGDALAVDSVGVDLEFATNACFRN